MSDLKSVLENRFKKAPQHKMEELAKKRFQGELSPFVQGFSTCKLSTQEEEKLRALLHDYAFENHDIDHDMGTLSLLSAQVKQIHHQAVLLHGERIKQVRNLLKTYREGAFSAWLVLSYGNRQTPYNFLMYYELFSRLPEALKLAAEKMPKQVIYTLASRQGPQEKKEEIIREYQGESKGDLLKKIRDTFPLSETDARQTSTVKQALSLVAKGASLLQRCEKFSEDECVVLEKLLKKLQKVKTKLFPNNKV